MSEWFLRHVSNQLHQVVNNTGEEARDVSMRVEGAVLPDFRFSAESVQVGDGPQQVFAQAWGEPGVVIIDWTSPDGGRRQVRVPVR